MSRIYLPLRTSVEFFRDPESPEAPTRAKQAAVLYDELVFEVGLFEASISSGGSFLNWRPPAMVGPEDFRNSRIVPEEGSGLVVSFGKQPAFGVPAAPDHMVPLIQGQLSVSYVAEWHTGVLDDLKKFDPAWVFLTTASDIELNKSELGRTIGQLDFQMLSANEFMSGADPLLRDYVYKSFHRDAVVATAMDAAVHVTSLFEPMLSHGIATPDPSGETALGLLVPDAGRLPWEAVVEYREHPGSAEARAKLREFEQLALSQEPGDALDFLRRVAQEVSNDFFVAVSELQGKLVKQLGEEAAKFGVSFIPIVGPFLGPGATVAEAVYDSVHGRRSWHAALMKLRGETNANLRAEEAP